MPHSSKKYRLLLLALGTWLCQGCTQPNTPEVVSVLSHTNCEISNAGVQKIQYSDIAVIRGSIMLDSSIDESQQDAENLIFLVLSNGEQATTGYKLSLAGPAKFVKEQLEVPVIWQVPAPETMQAQVLTHPCLVIALEWQGKGTIRFIDQSGQVMGSYPGTDNTPLPDR